MRLIFTKRVLSRSAIAALSPTEREQLLQAGMSVLRGISTLDDILRWCDKELLGWTQLELHRDGQRVLDVWMLANMDDGVLFDTGATSPNGIGVSQTEITDTTADRVELVREVQAAFDAYDDDPPYAEWERGR